MWIRHGASVLLTASLAACGGGGGVGNGPAVSNLSATSAAYNRTLTVTVFGSKLDDPGLFMTVDGPCGAVTRSGAASDFQATFTCVVNGLGPLSPRIRNASGLELARLQLNVPKPQVLMLVSQGSRTGSMTIELDPSAAPVTVKNFLDYAGANFYANTIFHRVLQNFVAQGGGYSAGPKAKQATAAAIVLESNNGLKNLRGTIAMAQDRGPDTATTQFYFNLVDNASLDYVSDAVPGYAVFGRIVTGLDVMDEIGKVAVAAVSTEFPALPTENVVVTFVTQSR